MLTGIVHEGEKKTTLHEKARAQSSKVLESRARSEDVWRWRGNLTRSVRHHIWWLWNGWVLLAHVLHWTRPYILPILFHRFSELPVIPVDPYVGSSVQTNHNVSLWHLQWLLWGPADQAPPIHPPFLMPLDTCVGSRFEQLTFLLKSLHPDNLLLSEIWSWLAQNTKPFRACLLTPLFLLHYWLWVTINSSKCVTQLCVSLHISEKNPFSENSFSTPIFGWFLFIFHSPANRHYTFC